MNKMRVVSIWCVVLLLAMVFTLPGFAQIKKERQDTLDDLAFHRDDTWVTLRADKLDTLRAEAPQQLVGDFESFQASTGNSWLMMLDRITGKPSLVEGGVPWIPGKGWNNSIKASDLGVTESVAASNQIPVEIVAGKAIEFLKTYPNLFGVDPADLTLMEGASGPMLDYLYNINFQWSYHGIPVENAYIGFYLNSGNLVMLGSTYICDTIKSLDPKPTITAETAWDMLWGYLGKPQPGDEILEPGRLLIQPFSSLDVIKGEQFAIGQGMEYHLVYVLAFRRPGVNGTWEARVDAHTGEIISFKDENKYGHIQGGVYKTDKNQTQTEVVVPFPYANYSGTTLYADVAGDFVGTTGTSTMRGRTGSAGNVGSVLIDDDCGAISLASDGTGLINFGTSSGTDCTTPGFGGAGNTHSARTQYWHVNQLKIKAYTYLSGNATAATWLQGLTNITVNYASSCNAQWVDGATGYGRFYRSGNGCGNTGELPGVSLHETGHGLDYNDGNGFSPEGGTGEVYGDTTAMLQTHQSCAGGGFFLTLNRGCGTCTSGYNCSGYGHCCTECSGVRDADYAKHTGAEMATPLGFNQVHCGSSTCVGPCNKECHCENAPGIQANWDLAVRVLTAAPYSMDAATAWQYLDKFWYASAPNRTGAFVCGNNTSSAVGNLFNQYRVVDDCDGNLANGTPHAAGIWQALGTNHQIGNSSSVNTDNNCSCASLATPVLSGTAANGQANLSWGAISGAGTYNVYRNETSCTSGYTLVGSTTSLSFIDSPLFNGNTYYYKIQALNGSVPACPPSAMSNCLTLTPVVVTCPMTVDVTPNGTTTVSAGSSIIFTASQSGGTSPFTYQWTENGSNISGATTSRYTATKSVGGTYTYNCKITDSSGDCTDATDATSSTGVWTAPNIVYSAHGAFTEVDGNGNGGMEAGEKYSVQVTLTNSGQVSASSVQASLSAMTDGDGITVCNNPGTFGTIAAGGTASYTFTFVVNSSTWYSKYACAANLTFNIVSKSTSTTGCPCANELAVFSQQIVGASGSNEVVTSAGGNPAKGVTTTYTLSPDTTLSGVTTATTSYTAASYLRITAVRLQAPGGATTNLTTPTANTTYTNDVTAFYNTNGPGQYSMQFTCTTGSGTPSVNTLSLTLVPAPACSTWTASCVACTMSVNVTPNGTTTACTGSNIIFTATPTGGTAPYTYQWTEGGTDISGATNSTYSANKASAGTFAYNCKVSCTGCTNITDATASTGTWVAPPTVTVTPSGTTTACTGANIVFTATSAGGTAPYTYQWTENGTNISGATNSTYTANKAAAGSFTYTCNVYSTGCATAGTDTTASTGTWVAPPTSVTVTPSGTTTACTGANIVFTATVVGGATPLYQWTEGGTNISGATNSTYTANKAAAGSFTYTCIVNNTGCATTVTDATPSTGTWVAPPTLDVTPNGTTTVCTGANIIFTATASGGAAPYTYQWTENGGNIAGATNSTYTANKAAAGSFTYSCLAYSTGCATAGTDATASTGTWVAAPTSVTVTPSGTTTACTGANIVLTATVVGGATPLYQWTENGGNIAGATNSTYTANKAAAGSFTYTCIVNSTGCATTVTDATPSTGTWIAAPTVDVTPNGTTTVCTGANIIFTATASGGTAPYTYQWTENGTNISGATNSTYTANKAAAGSFTYTCNVYSTGCATAGTDATASTGTWVAPPTSVTVTPSGTTTACTGANIVLTATVAGGATPVYQWTENGTNISGATNSTYTANKAAAGSFTYTCIVYNTGCATTVTDATPSTGTWVVAPTVDVTPNGTTSVTVGNPITFTASSSGGTAPYTYQWTRDGGDIAGATNSTLTETYGTIQSHAYNCKVSSTGCATQAQDVTASTGDWQAGSVPAEVPSQSWTDTETQIWDAVSGATGYKLQRGQLAGLPELLTANEDSCNRYGGAVTSISTLTEDPTALSAGDFYWYLVIAYNLSGDGPAGDATTGPRIVNNSGSCP